MPAKYHFEAAIFDLDGVITRTALVHSHAWKKMFDDYLRQRERIALRLELHRDPLVLLGEHGSHAVDG